MANYTKATNFAIKDTLLSGNPLKIVKGAEIDAEFVSIQSAVNSKLDGSFTALNNLFVDNTLTNGTINGGTY